MDLYTLCEKIGLQKEMKDQIHAFMCHYDVSNLECYIEALRQQDTSEEAHRKLVQLFGDRDPSNIPLLTCQLLAAARNYERFRAMNISDQIYFDTMAAYTRFCKESYRDHGNWNYYHAGWSYRQSSMTLFRIGILEYEFVIRDEEPMISIHIPSDTVFTEENLDQTIHSLKKFLADHYPERSRDRIYCESWIMAPKLQKLLPPTSGIMRFHNRFAFITESLSPDCCLGWVFHCTNQTPLEELPEETSLQRKIKEMMLSGDHLYGGFGILTQGEME